MLVLGSYEKSCAHIEHPARAQMFVRVSYVKLFARFEHPIQTQIFRIVWKAIRML
jgi:hypothetical protein